MKRFLLALVVVGLLVGSSAAIILDFQDSSDATDIKIMYSTGNNIPNNYISWIHNQAAGNSCMYTYSQAYGSIGFANLDPYPMTYAAATLIESTSSANVARIGLYDSGGSSLYGYSIPWDSGMGMLGRWEMEIVGGKAYIYKNGILKATSGVLSKNPSYVSFGNVYGGSRDGSTKWDDVVYGESENHYVFGNPEANFYYLAKDMTTPAASGLYAVNGTLINSNNVTTTFARSNLTEAGHGNETIVLQNVDTGIVYGTRYTGLIYNGSVSWALGDEIFNSGAPYGRYYVTSPGTGAYSEEIWYIGNGATIAFDKTAYANQDVATLTYTIQGSYWDTSTYDYSIDIISATTGATIQTTPISLSSGTTTYSFTTTDPLGLYYGIVKATKRSDDTVIWMNYDYAELNSYVTIAGYVNDAETQLPISGAVVNITQNSITGFATTIADGNYSLTNYLAGTALSINATASGYSKYYINITPLSARTLSLNITLNSTTPAYSGLGI